MSPSVPAQSYEDIFITRREIRRYRRSPHLKLINSNLQDDAKSIKAEAKEFAFDGTIEAVN